MAGAAVVSPPTHSVAQARRDLLQAMPYFAGLETKALDALAARARHVAYASGELIFQEGDPCSGLFIIERGRCKIYKTSLEGREQTLHVARPGQSFNDVAAMDGGPNPANVMAVDEVSVLVIAREDLRALARLYPDIAWALMESIARRARHLVGMVEDLGLRSVKARLAKLLLEEAERSAPQKELARSHLMTQQEMASRLGTVREMVGRGLRSLADDGLIRIERHRIIVVDRAALEAQAML